MTKHLIPLAIAVLFILVVGFSGCNEMMSYLSADFVGEWKRDSGRKWIFYDNGELFIENSTYPNVTWKKYSGYIVVTRPDGNIKMDYTFEDDDWPNSLTLRYFNNARFVTITLKRI